MKIGLIHLNLAAESGDPRMFLSLAQALKKQGHTVVVYTAEDDPKYFPELHQGLDIRLVPPPTPLAEARGAKTIWGKVKERLGREKIYAAAAEKIGHVLEPDFDILECHNDHSYELGREYKKKNPNCAVVWMMNNAPFYHSKKTNPIMNALSLLAAWRERLRIRPYLSGLDLIVVHDKERADLCAGLGVPVVLLNIPVNFENFYHAPHTLEPGEKRVTLLGVGSLSPARAFEDIIIAAGLLLKDGYDARVVLICRDFWNNEKYKHFLFETTTSSGMDGRVDFRFDGAHDDELKKMQAESEFYVFPNRIIIWSMATFEALAAGLPVVVSRITSAAAALRDGETGLLSEPGQPETIAAKIKEAMTSPGLYDKLAVQGQEFVKQNLTWEKYAKDFVANGQKSLVKTHESS